MWAENSMLLCAVADCKDPGLEHGQMKGKKVASFTVLRWNEKQLSGFLPCWVVSFQWQERGWWQTFLDTLHKEVNHQNIRESSWWQAKWLSFALFGWEISHFLCYLWHQFQPRESLFYWGFLCPLPSRLHLPAHALTIVLMAGKCWAEEKESPLFRNLNNLSYLRGTLYL